MIEKDKLKEDVKPHVADKHQQRKREKLKFSLREAASMLQSKNLTLDGNLKVDVSTGR